MSKNKEYEKNLLKLYSKLGTNGTMLSSIFLTAGLVSEEKMPPITFGILSVSLISSGMLLVKTNQRKKLLLEENKVKKKNWGSQILEIMI